MPHIGHLPLLCARRHPPLPSPTSPIPPSYLLSITYVVGLLQLSSNLIFAFDFARTPIRLTTVSELGSSMVRVSFEEEGKSLLASLIASAFDGVSTEVSTGVVLPVAIDNP